MDDECCEIKTRVIIVNSQRDPNNDIHSSDAKYLVGMLCP